MHPQGSPASSNKKGWRMLLLLALLFYCDCVA